MKYHIITYGCQMNRSDSERIANALENLGFIPYSQSNKVDLFILNVCSVRQSAIDRIISKAESIKSKLLITGCILQKDKKRFGKISDGIFNIADLTKLPKILKNLGFKIKNTGILKSNHYLETEPKYESNIIADIPIMTGCNNFCSYCVVPYTRGKEISRPIKDIVCEAKKLIQNGIKEIWLLGQNVNSYKPNFAKLLKQVNDIKGDFWIRFTSSHPKDLTSEMIETMAKCQKATPYFNLPIQSGDDNMLKAMNRPYSVKKYKELIKETRQAFKKYRKGLEKEVAISTDAIVGFPGETKKQFENTKKTFEEIKFAFGYISRYSPRPGTTAARMKDNVSSIEKKKQKKELEKIIEKTALDFNKKFLNKEIDVLILEKKKDFFIGKTRHYQTIKIPAFCNEAGPRCKVGEFVKAKVTEVKPYGLQAKLIEARLRQGLRQG